MPTAARDIKMLTEACRHGAAFSIDPSTQNGALILALTGEVVMAANTLPGIQPTTARMTRPNKYFYVEHAERNVIYTAARNGICTDKATLYCPWFACADCARAIIQAGISRVVGHAVPYAQTPDRWKESVAKADEMFHEAGVKLVYLTAPLNVSFLFDGKVLEL